MPQGIILFRFAIIFYFIHFEILFFFASLDYVDCFPYFSIFDLQTSQPDELLPGLLEPTPQDELDRQNDAERNKDRVKQLFSVYLSSEEVGIIILVLNRGLRMYQSLQLVSA